MAGIYIHVPFCRKACHYCDFHFSTNRQNETQMVEAMVHEMHLRRDYLPDKNIETIYLGGGTPSLLSEALLAALFEALHRIFSVSHGAEVTLEANPDDLSPRALAFFSSLGINRLSIGVQTFHDPVLRFLNRTHTGKQAVEAYRRARNAGFSNINLDLIFAIPGQTLQDIEQDVHQIIRLNPEHVSAYTLTIEEKTVFGNWLKKGRLVPATEEDEAAAFLLVSEQLITAGYGHYEVSNYARPGFKSRHNSHYWKRVPYLGIGPGAHSFNGVSRQANIANNYRYMEQINQNAVPATPETLTREDHINECIMTGLRTEEGVDLDFLRLTFQYSPTGAQAKLMDNWQQLGYAEIKNGRLRLTRTGLLLADKIAAELFTG
ncbi:MAG: coproporphyrinogen III oxidase [Cyclobacteriaceae bacterium]|nr:MAG: coproporphyrinogen III oxidase [Cyclobacteriaceae bacterium]